jgi:hypothetical protein
MKSPFDSLIENLERGTWKPRDTVLESSRISPFYDLDPLDELRPLFVCWFDSRVWLDAPAVAQRSPNPSWVTSVNALHADLCRWIVEQDQVPPPTRAEFTHLLRELCCEIRLIAGEEFVSNVALMEDTGAQ